MILKKPTPNQIPTVSAHEIHRGTVFSGIVKFNGGAFFPSTEIEGFFLRIQSHILNLENHDIYGCGLSGGANTPMGVSCVANYKPYPDSTLEIK